MTESNFSVEKEREQIPRILHYFWGGDKDPFSSPGIMRTCYESWKKFAPDFEIKRWDESNFDMGSTKFTQYHFNKKLWAMVSDYIRFYALYTEGGIYVDTDQEICRPLDDLLVYPFFTGFENPLCTPGEIPTLGLGFVGSVPAHPFSKQMMEGMERDFLRKRVYMVTVRSRELLKEKGLTRYGEQNISDGIHLFPYEAFYSFDPLLQLEGAKKGIQDYPSEEAFMAAGRPFIDPSAYAVHWYRGGWRDSVDFVYPYPWYQEWWYRFRRLSFYRHVDGFLKHFSLYRRIKEPIHKLRIWMEKRNSGPTIMRPKKK
ncbi:MAG: glycosyltransferase [Cytophagales bacterium]|nr:glycosyltransferase [Cytophagales bacterium]